MKRISILGSTGSIGTQALDIIEHHPDRLSVAALSCAKQLDLLRDQIRKFHPAAVCVAREEDARILQMEFPQLDVYHGMKGLTTIASMEDCDMVLNSLLGMQGLEPTLAAAKAGKDIAFAYEKGGSWRPLGPVQDASILSTDHAGGFVAATVGPFATCK